MTRIFGATIIGFTVMVLSLPLAVVLLKESPRIFGPDRWSVLLAGGLIAAIFAYREGGVRGAVAGGICVVTACLALAHPDRLESIGRRSLLLILTANLIGLARSAIYRVLGCVILALVAVSMSWVTVLLVFMISAFSWGQAELLHWLGPKLASPLIKVVRGLPFVFAFIIGFFILLLYFAVMFFMLYVIDPGSFAKPQGIEHLGFEAFFYQSVRVMTTAGPAYEPLTPWARLLVGLELLASVCILIIFLNLVISRATSSGPSVGSTAQLHGKENDVQGRQFH